jgi:hypothetical protein
VVLSPGAGDMKLRRLEEGVYAEKRPADEKKVMDLLFLLFWQVKNAKHMEMCSFFTPYIVLGVVKSQDLPSRVWQTLEDVHDWILIVKYKRKCYR